jgi:DNA polymerase (family 10)
MRGGRAKTFLGRIRRRGARDILAGLGLGGYWPALSQADPAAVSGGGAAIHSVSMPPGNDSLAAVFRDLVQLAVLDEGDPSSFRVRAYERALETIRSHQGDLSVLSEKELTKLDGVGVSTAKKIREFYQSGTIGKLEELRKKYPPGFVELSRIPGLGPKTLQRLRAELGVEDVAGLRAALAAQKLRTVKGLGEKAEEKIRHAVERLGERAKENRRPIAEAMPIARELVAALEALPGVERAQYCGSLRRLRETVADVDIVAAASVAPEEISAAFVAMPAVREVIGGGGTKTSVRTATGLQVDLRVVDPRSFGAACQYFTGSKTHNIKLRQRALERGWLLNEYGLTDNETGRVIASETEEDVYRALGLPLIPPPMREDRGEVELAEAGPLPEVRLADIRGDLHVHTTLSGDGKSPLEDVLAAVAARGYEYVAITDHAEDLYMNGVSRQDLARQRTRIEGLRAAFPSLAILHGAELNIGRDGGLDYDAVFRRTLDWCVAGVHSHFDLGRAEQTRRVLAAMDDPTVHAIAHLTGRRIGHREGIDVDLDAVLDKAEATGVALEVNAALGRLDLSSDALSRARGRSVTFVVDTDAHHVRELDRMEWGVLQAMRGFVDPARIANLWPRERFLGWLTDRRSR